MEPAQATAVNTFSVYCDRERREIYQPEAMAPGPALIDYRTVRVTGRLS